MSYLVVDIETVPDLKIWQPPKAEPPPPEAAAPDIAPAPANGKKPRAKKPPKAPKAPEDVFPPLYAHRVVAIGFVELDDNLMPANIGCVGTRTFGDDEPKLLAAFSEWAAKLQPAVVTFAGRTFDIPVISLRAFYHGVPQHWYTPAHRYRYGDDHTDVFDVMTDRGAVQRTGFGLDTLCSLIGLPGKGEVNGSRVQGLIKEGKAALVEGYCTCDTVKTAFLFLRLLLLRGQIPIEKYRDAARALLAKATEYQLTGVTFGADPSRLLLEPAS